MGLFVLMGTDIKGLSVHPQSTRIWAATMLTFYERSKPFLARSGGEIEVRLALWVMATHKRSPAAALLGGNSAKHIRFSRGVLLGHDQDMPFVGVPDETGINPDDGSAADLWVIDPSEFDDERIVVVVDERCTRRTSFERWLLHATAVPPEDAPLTRLFVPERAAGRLEAVQRLQAWIDGAGINAEAVSYHPPHVW